jgi:hypothetical protein
MPPIAARPAVEPAPVAQGGEIATRETSPPPAPMRETSLEKS